ncbi:MAG: mandelate racemase/muconate lactonizing enzyme family protein [Thermomicrobiales bacterium]
MKITALEPILLTAPLGSGSVTWSGGTLTKVNLTLVRVHTDEGITGLGETYGGLFAPLTAKAIFEHFASLAVGQDAANITGIWQRLWAGSMFWGRSGMAVSVLSAIEMALWDINGKALGVPAWRLIGGLAHESIPVYASGGLDQSSADFQRELTGYAEEGFGAIKFRIGHGASQDGAKAELARKTMGDDFTLMCDAVQGHNPNPWRAADAIAVADALADYGLAWFEEPCSATDYAGYAAVRAKARMPIAGGESSVTIHEFKHFFDRGALDIAQPDAGHAGGMWEYLRIANLADAFGVRVVPHAWGSGPLIMANLHCAFANPATFMFEFPTIHNPLRLELLVEPLVMTNGIVTPPTAPGLGVDLPDSLIERYPFEPGTEVRMVSTR